VPGVSGYGSLENDRLDRAISTSNKASKAADQATVLNSHGDTAEPSGTVWPSPTLETMADRRQALSGKIERLRWLLNLFLLDGFERDELERLKTEVAAFKRDEQWLCAELRKAQRRRAA
jgi:hypothetical protein